MTRLPDFVRRTKNIKSFVCTIPHKLVAYVAYRDAEPIVHCGIVSIVGIPKKLFLMGYFPPSRFVFRRFVCFGLKFEKKQAGVI